MWQRSGAPRRRCAAADKGPRESCRRPRTGIRQAETPRAACWWCCGATLRAASRAIAVPARHKQICAATSARGINGGNLGCHGPVADAGLARPLAPKTSMISTAVAPRRRALGLPSCCAHSGRPSRCRMARIPLALRSVWCCEGRAVRLPAVDGLSSSCGRLPPQGSTQLDLHLGAAASGLSVQVRAPPSHCLLLHPRLCLLARTHPDDLSPRDPRSPPSPPTRPPIRHPLSRRLGDACGISRR